MKATCLQCSSEFTFKESSSTGKFCSSSCSGLYQRQQVTKPKVEAGLVSIRSTLYRYLVDNRGDECAICTLAGQWQGKKLTLHVDHIDGDSDNNFPANLRLLCPNCHSQTETFCGRNKKTAKRNVYLQTYRATKKVRR